MRLLSHRSSGVAETNNANSNNNNAPMTPRIPASPSINDFSMGTAADIAEWGEEFCFRLCSEKEGWGAWWSVVRARENAQNVHGLRLFLFFFFTSADVFFSSSSSHPERSIPAMLPSLLPPQKNNRRRRKVPPFSGDVAGTRRWAQIAGQRPPERLRCFGRRCRSRSRIVVGRFVAVVSVFARVVRLDEGQRRRQGAPLEDVDPR